MNVEMIMDTGVLNALFKLAARPPADLYKLDLTSAQVVLLHAWFREQAPRFHGPDYAKLYKAG